MTTENTQVVEEQVQNNDTFEARLERGKKLFGIADGLDSVRRVRAEIQQRQLSTLGGEQDKVDALSARILNYTPAQLRAMTADQINDLYKSEDGEIEIAADFSSPERELEMKRSFLIYLVESDQTMKLIDAETDRLEQELAANQDEYEQLVNSFDNLDGYIQELMQTEYDKSEGERKIRLGLMMQAYRDANSLINIETHYKNFGVRNTLEESKSLTRAQRSYELYVRVMRKLGIRTDISIPQFNNLEARFLPEKYHAHPNLLLYSIVKYIGYRKDSAKAQIEGVFLNQLVVNLKWLATDKFPTPERKQAFLNGMMSVLDLFIPEETIIGVDVAAGESKTVEYLHPSIQTVISNRSYLPLEEEPQVSDLVSEDNDQPTEA